MGKKKAFPPKTSKKGLSEEEMYAKVEHALTQFILNEQDLLDVDASERSISHKMAEYLQKEFFSFHVDCEYNRQGEYPKMLETLWNDEAIKAYDYQAKTVFPDIIIHERGVQEKNLIVIEIKKSSSRRSHDKDIAKLKAFTSPSFNYCFGLFLVVAVSEAVYEG